MPEEKAVAEAKALRTTDAATMRALAHPLRVEILSLLDAKGEFTASQVAERLGQTVANASFHLRTLEKHGYVERGEQRGREKPWRSAHTSRNLTPDPANMASVSQASSVASIYVQREAARLVQTLDRAVVDPPSPDWVLATTVTNSSFWATKEEMAELARQVEKLTEPFRGRSDNPGMRPAGARKGYLFASVNPDPDTEPWDPDTEHPEGS